MRYLLLVVFAAAAQPQPRPTPFHRPDVIPKPLMKIEPGLPVGPAPAVLRTDWFHKRNTQAAPRPGLLSRSKRIFFFAGK
jgi:hypothetical protein